MPQELANRIDRWMEIADKRNLAVENPVTLLVEGGAEQFFVCVSYMEPNNVTLPFNVTWIVADDQSVNYRKALRRVSSNPFNGLRNTWAQLFSFQDVLDENQFWDATASFQLGEVQTTGIGLATEESRGFVQLNRTALDPLDPVVVTDDDERMINARQPLPHTHPKLPITMMRGSTGINSFFVNITDGQQPSAGQALFLTGQGALPNEWYGRWEYPQAADVVYDGPTFENLVINGPDPATLNEDDPYVFTADAEFSDGSTIASIPAEWSIIANTSAGNISPSTGVFNANNITGDQLVRVQARWTHADSGQERIQTFEFTVVDTTVTALVTSITVNGAQSLDEGNNTATYTVTAHYDDGSSQGVVPTTFTSSNASAGVLNTSTGVFTSALNVTSDQLTTFSLTYVENGVTVGTTYDVTVVDTTVYPMSASVQGPASVAENTSETYSLVVTFTDMSTSQVTVSNWATTNPAAGTIDPISGLFTAPTNLNADETTVLSASYTANGVTVSGNRNIIATDETVYPVSAVVLGPSSVDENNVATYQLQVTFTDSTVQTVVVSDWASSDPAVGTIDSASGLFEAAEDLPSDATAIISASYTSEGQTVSGNATITVNDTTNYPTHVEIIGSATLGEGATQSLVLRVTYQDTTTQDVNADSWLSSNTGAATISNSGLVTAALNLQANESTTISASYTEHGVTLTDDLTITVTDDTVYPVSAVVEGLSTVSEASSTTYQLRVTFDDGTNQIVAANDFASSNPAAGTIGIGGTFTAPSSVPSDVTTDISATWTVDGVTVSGTLTITVTDDTVYPVVAEIIGPNAVDENTTQTYQLRVTFTDASTQFVSVSDWASSDPAVGTINASTGLFSGLSVTSDSATTISASYTSEGQTVSDTLEVTVRDTTIYPVSATIVGNTSVPEGSSETFEFQVTFSDSSTSVVPVSTWATTNALAGVINATTGVFQAVSNVTQDTNTTLSASYTANGETVNASQQITVTDITAYPVSAVVVGPSTLDENTSTTFALSVTFDNSSTSTVSPTDWAIDNPAAGTINPTTGEFTAADNTTGANITAIVSASWDVDGVIVTGQRNIAVRDLDVYPQSAQIVGPAVIDEGSVETYQLQITYTDSSTQFVSVTDWASTNANAGSIDSASGVFTANNNITSQVVTTLSASWSDGSNTYSDTMSVTVSDTLLRPVSAVILGSTSVDEGQTSNYQLEVTYDNGGTSVVSATNWAIDNADAGSIGASSGVLSTANVLEDQSAQISASWSENGESASATLDIVVNYLRLPTSAIIVGPTALDEADVQAYTFDVTFDDGSVESVTINDWNSNNGVAGVLDSSGTFTAASNVTTPTQTTLSGSYTENGDTVSATLDITVDNTANLPVSAQIIGLTTFNEGQSSTFQFRVNYEDGTNQIVSVSDWAVNNGTAGTIDASTGTFVASADVTGDQSATVSASYTEHGVTVDDTHDITVVDASIILQSIEITGPVNVTEGNTGQYTATATYADTSTVDVTASASWSVDTGGSIDSSGLFTAVADVASDTPAVISVSFTDGDTVTDTLNITVRDDVLPLARWGVATHNGTDFQGHSGSTPNLGTYQSWTGVQDFMDSVTTTLMPSNNNGELMSADLNDIDDYAYFAHPVELGIATHIDQSNMFPGGWDGVTWDEGDFSGPPGPIVVQYDDGTGLRDWYIYRTDFPGIGNMTWAVSYANN